MLCLSSAVEVDCEYESGGSNSDKKKKAREENQMSQGIKGIDILRELILSGKQNKKANELKRVQTQANISIKEKPGKVK